MKNTPAKNLHMAVKEYVEHHGGRVVVSGPIQLQKWPHDRKYIYYLAIKIAGTPPKHSKEEIEEAS